MPVTGSETAVILVIGVVMAIALFVGVTLVRRMYQVENGEHPSLCFIRHLI
jgi:hypothetical protein